MVRRHTREISGPFIGLVLNDARMVFGTRGHVNTCMLRGRSGFLGN